MVRPKGAARMADQTKLPGQESQVTPFKGHTLQRSPNESQTAHSSKQQKRLASPLSGSESKRQDNTEKDALSIGSDSDDEDNALEEIEVDNDQIEESPSQLAIDETFGKSYDDVAQGIQIMDRLQEMVNAIVRAKKTPSPTQAKQLANYTQDAKVHLNRIQTQYLQLQGKYLEQANTISKLINKNTKDIAKIQETIIKEVSKINITNLPVNQPTQSYASIAKAGQPINAKANTKVILIYPKEENKNQSSEETKLEIQKCLHPKRMKLQVNRISKIRNGGIALEIPKDRVEELNQVLKTGFDTRSPKINRPKFKIFDVPADMDKEKFVQEAYDQNFTDNLSFEVFQNHFIPLFKTGPRNENTTQWIVEIGKAVREHISENDRIYLGWQACKIKPYIIVTRCFKCHRYGHSAKACAQENPTCGHCAKEGHSLKECPDKEWNYRCANCMRDKNKLHKHDVASNKCPLYLQELQRAQKLTNYEY